MIKPRIIYMGTPEFAVAPLKTLINNGYNIQAVVTVPDKPSGRGLKFNESAIKQFAKEQGLPILQPASLKDPVFSEQLASYNSDLFIVVAFRMLPKSIWSMPSMGTFNLHASLLPQYRGAAPINWAIINGEKISGATTFMIDEKIDTGAILMQRECEIDAHETIGTLYDKLMKIGSQLVLDTVKGISDGSLIPKAQSGLIKESGIIKDAPKITKELCRIKWNNNAIDTERLIRGLSPYPCAFATLTNEEKSIDIKIFDAECCEDNNMQQGSETENKNAGTILCDGKTYLKVICGNGILSIKELQVSGKKRMKVRDFLAGFRDIGTYRFV